MSRSLIGLSLSGSIVVALACDDQTVEEVSKEVCYSGMRWIGEKRGSPEMFPGRDCVGCHIENDGPPLALGGTLYAYVLFPPEVFELQKGEDCFGVQGITISVEDNDGQLFELVTNRAGNFFVEGNPNDLAKPFTVSINQNLNPAGVPGPQMRMSPMYGGCARCHDPAVAMGDYDPLPTDADYTYGQPRIGLGGYKPNGADSPSVEEELRALVAAP